MAERSLRSADFRGAAAFSTAQRTNKTLTKGPRATILFFRRVGKGPSEKPISKFFRPQPLDIARFRQIKICKKFGGNEQNQRGALRGSRAEIWRSRSPQIPARR